MSASGTISQSSAIRGDDINGTYSGFTPTGVTVGGVFSPIFSAGGGNWNGAVSTSVSNAGPYVVVLTDGVNSPVVGAIDVLVPSDDLITSDRANQNSTLAAIDPAALASLITAASLAIENVCKHKFGLNDYTEVYSGGGVPYMEIQLAQYPVTAISRIATAPQAAMLVTNNSTANQRATVATTSTGLVLTRVASAVETVNTLLFSTYATLGSLVAAVAGVGFGWTATVPSTYENFPSADLLPLQGASTALQGGATLSLYTEDSPAWGSTGMWVAPWGYVGDGPGWRLDADVGYLLGAWPQGKLNIRIDYTSGDAVIPEDIQEACVQHVQDLYQSSLINNNVASARLGPFAYTTLAKVNGFSSKVMTLLQPHTDHGKLLMRRGADYL